LIGRRDILKLPAVAAAYGLIPRSAAAGAPFDEADPEVGAGDGRDTLLAVLLQDAEKVPGASVDLDGAVIDRELDDGLGLRQAWRDPVQDRGGAKPCQHASTREKDITHQGSPWFERLVTAARG